MDLEKTCAHGLRGGLGSACFGWQNSSKGAEWRPTESEEVEYVIHVQKKRPKRKMEGLIVVIELRKVADQNGDSLASRRKAIRQPRYREWLTGPA